MSLRICFLTTEYPPEVYWGGIATYTEAMAGALAGLGCEVHVVAKSEIGDRYERVGDVHVHWVTGRRPTWLLPLRYARISTEWMVYLARRVAERVRWIEARFGKVDVIESVETQAAAFWLTCVRGGPPVVTHVANPGYSTRRHTQVEGHRVDFLLRDFMEREQTIRSVGITSPSSVMADKVAGDWHIRRGRIRVIPYPAPRLPAEEDASVYEELLRGKEYMLFFGRLQALKGVHVIAQALPEVLRRFSRIHMVFVARDLPYRGGTMKEYVLERCRGYESRLVFIEKLPKERLVPVIRGARACVLPSLWESFQLTVLESLSLGKVTIASRGTGAQEIIEHGKSGFLVRGGDVEELRRAMARLLDMSDDRREAMHAAALRRAGKFDVERTAAMKLGFLREVAERR